MDLRYDFFPSSLQNYDLSAEHDVTGIDPIMFVIVENIGNIEDKSKSLITSITLEA